MSITKTRRTTAVEITERDLELLKALSAAGWLDTRQIRDRFFAGKTTHATCKRLRKLVAGKYVGTARQNSTECALYRLAGQGKLLLLEHTELEPEEIAIPTQVPRKLGHFRAINDLRFAFEELNGERGAKLVFFFSERELALYHHDRAKARVPILRLLQSYRIIPDALARIKIADQEGTRDMDVAIEFDAGTEHASFFGRTKIIQYAALVNQNLDWLADFKVLTFTSSVKRIVSLMRQVVSYRAPQHLFYFAPVDKLDGLGWEDEGLFLEPYDFFIPVRQGNQTGIVEKEVGGGAIPNHALAGLPATCSRSQFPRGNSQKPYILPEEMELHAE
ncbi:MAG: replication-relaxation family protein [Blastocatellia bacterium]